MISAFDRKIYKFFILLLLPVCLFFSFCGIASADDNSSIKGLEDAAKKGYGSIEEGSGIVTSLPEAIGKVLGVVLSFIGVAFLLLMIYGGFTWMLARGNEQDVTKAKDLIQAAIIGLVIVFMAYAITAFVGNALLGGT